jgi:hypothetical protein
MVLEKTKPICILPQSTPGAQSFLLYILYPLRSLRTLRLINLKKQSQFDGGQIGAKFYLKGSYDNKPPCGADKNKPNLLVRRTACCVLRKGI